MSDQVLLLMAGCFHTIHFHFAAAAAAPALAVDAVVGVGVGDGFPAIGAAAEMGIGCDLC